MGEKKKVGKLQHFFFHNLSLKSRNGGRIALSGKPVKLHKVFYKCFLKKICTSHYGWFSLFGEKSTILLKEKHNRKLSMKYSVNPHWSLAINNFISPHLPGTDNLRMMRENRRREKWRGKTSSDSRDHIILNTPAHTALPKKKKNQLWSIFSFELGKTGTPPVLNGKAVRMGGSNSISTIYVNYCIQILITANKSLHIMAFYVFHQVLSMLK